MSIRTTIWCGVEIALVDGDVPVITDAQSALDLIANVRYATGCDRVVVGQAAISESFFRLSTRVAGDVLQKFVNYRMKLAIVGDFSRYTSKPLRDFIYESNNGRDVFFVSNENDALDRLARV